MKRISERSSEQPFILWSVFLWMPFKKLTCCVFKSHAIAWRLFSSNPESSRSLPTLTEYKRYYIILKSSLFFLPKSQRKEGQADQMFAFPVVAASHHGVGIHVIYSFGVISEPLLRDHFKYLTLFSPDFSFFQEGYFLLFPAKWALPVSYSVPCSPFCY